MKTLMMIGFIWWAALPPAAAQSDPLKDVRQWWLQGRYREVLDAAVALRTGTNRSAELDYLIGTSACRSGKGDLGRSYLNWCASRYTLAQETIDAINREITRCGASEDPARIILTAVTAGQAGVVASLKTYAALPDEAVVSLKMLETNRPVSLAELQSRVVPLGQEKRALDEAASRAGTGYKAQAAGRFIVVGPEGDDSGGVGQLLNNYSRFYSSTFGLTLPESYVTVYLAPTLAKLADFASSLHGFKLPYKCIGYSHQSDLSILVLHVGAKPQGAIRPVAVNGSVCHELFHLMAHTSFGDIPTWLDEGTAALYEVSSFQEGRALGLENWRRAVLERNSYQMPSLEALVSMKSSEFSRAGLERQALYEATARYLMFYLQQNGQLAKVFTAFRNATPETAEVQVDSPAKASVAILERAMGDPIQALDSEFRQWVTGSSNAKNLRSP